MGAGQGVQEPESCRCAHILGVYEVQAWEPAGLLQECSVGLWVRVPVGASSRDGWMSASLGWERGWGVCDEHMGS